MMAICPAGPPKLINPSLSQNLKASLNVGFGGASISEYKSLFLFAEIKVMKYK